MSVREEELERKAEEYASSQKNVFGYPYSQLNQSRIRESFLAGAHSRDPEFQELSKHSPEMDPKEEILRLNRERDHIRGELGAILCMLETDPLPSKESALFNGAIYALRSLRKS